MTFPLTPLSGWYDRAKAAFRGVVGAVVDLWPNVYAIIAKVLALLAQEFDLRLAFLFRQIFVSRADEPYVKRHAFEYGIAGRQAARATGSVTVTSDGAGTIPAGVVFARGDGFAYLTTSSTMVAAGPNALEVQADRGGLASNLAAGSGLTLLTTGLPVALTAPVVAAGGLTGGQEAEDIEELRARVLERRRTPPQGGSATDWTAWAREVPGVLRVWVDSFSNTDRRVWLTFTATDRVNGIPESGDVAALQAYLSDPVRRPVTARVTVVAPVAVPVDIEIEDLAVDTVATRAAIAAELAALFAERMEAVTPNRNFVLPVAWISEAISRAIGEDRHTLAEPSADIAFTTSGNLPVLGTITYV